MRLMLVFSFGTTLETWVRQGLIARERRYYGLFVDKGIPVQFLTYGDKDIDYKSDLESIEIVPKRKVNHLLIYAFLAPFIHWREFRQTRIFKSNQSQGALIGLLGRILVRRSRFVMRCGWVRTREMMVKEQGLSGWRMRKAIFTEWLGFRFSDAVVVVTPSDADYVVQNYRIPRKKITVVPNAVDEVRYSYLPSTTPIQDKLKIVLIGRLVEMKNFHGVIEAAGRMNHPCEITIIGDGPYKSVLQTIAEKHSIDVTFLANIDNDDVPRVLNEHNLFMIIQTHASGMPKVILEAMSAGLITISSDIRAHRELIQSGVNGFLCGLSVDEIASSIGEVLAMTSGELDKIRLQARQDIEKNYSMVGCVTKEIALYQSLLDS